VIRVHGISVPTDVSEIVDPDRVVLLIIDMQNDYCMKTRDHAVLGLAEQYAQTIPRIRNLLDACRARDIPVIHARMVSQPGRTDSPSWLRLRLRARTYTGSDRNSLPDAVVEGSWGADFVEDLQPSAGEAIVSKTRSSAFFGTPLDSLIRHTGRETVLFAGCTTEGCVESSVRDAGFRDYFPVVLTDCVASASPPLHEASLLVMGSYRAELLTSTGLLNAWADGSKSAT
jgi:nicotinamidase-related amidase